MLAAMLTMVGAPATGMVVVGPRSILTYTVEQSDEARWSAVPSTGDLAATAAARVPGGSRVALKCSADGKGELTGCEVVAAEPDRLDVREAALRMSAIYRLDADGANKARWSRMPPVVWLPILFPDAHGEVPDDCRPAFGCIVEYMPPPPPPPPSAPDRR